MTFSLPALYFRVGGFWHTEPLRPFAGVVLQGDADGALSTVVNDLEGLDVALVQQDLSDALLHVGSGNIHGLVLGIVGVADTGEHIGNRISDVHS